MRSRTRESGLGPLQHELVVDHEHHCRRSGEGGEEDPHEIGIVDTLGSEVLVGDTREQTPEDVGKLTVFLCSDDARNITGQIIALDGGIALQSGG